ncbi:Fpg/Nei family DNA glycosylase [Gordonia crocea]|uniref:Putative formamidopyrimidine-DNA glycosylase n=1 Tax=Gordonia crocea TaxID=589162 RepID=A0A7I9UVC7_9ACTN|nr:Fpg/Nei family DNA glycosylase [Gordonia crocea]GED96949.1 putative formamidopyrimidine-DNA glycosylase [Gordonia crocea]
MPELPEVTAIANFLDERAAGLPIRRVDVASLAVLKTADPPYTALAGRIVSTVGRIGKYLVITTGADDDEPLYLVIHLSRAGWVRWSANLSPTPPRPGGKGPIALRVHCGLPGEGFDVTEAGTQKRLAVWLVTDPEQVPRIAGLGPDVLSLSRESLAQILAGSSARIKNLLTDQRVIAGVGNAYSDEILHRARLSPFATAKHLSDAQIDALYEATGGILREAINRLEGPGGVSTMKAEKRSGLQIHGRTGLPCPVCGDTVAEVSFSDRSFQYCPTCQTGGRKLADRRMSRLLK